MFPFYCILARDPEFKSNTYLLYIPGGVPGVHGWAKLRLLVRNLAHLTQVVVEVVFSRIGRPQVKQLKSVAIMPDDILEAGDPGGAFSAPGVFQQCCGCCCC